MVDPGRIGADARREDGPACGEPLRGVVPGRQSASLSGLERVRAWARRTVSLPPLCHLVGLRVSQVEPASVTVTLPGSPWLNNGVGILVAPDLLSAAAAELAGMTVAGAADRTRLVALNAQAMRMAREGDGPFSAHGTVVHAGRTFIREILVSSTIRDLTAGAGLRLEDRGAHNLKGLDHEWELFAVRD